MTSIFRNLAAVIVGLLIGGTCNSLLVVLGAQLIPAPTGINPSDLDSVRANAHLLKPQHFLFPFLAHAAGTLAGALIAHLIAGTRRGLLSLLVGVCFLAGGIAAATMIPAPAWFIALDLLAAYVPMALLGGKLGAKLRPVSTNAP